jgi:predicted phage terminase large subunit-like protein
MFPGTPTERNLALLQATVLANPWIPDGSFGWADGKNHRIPSKPQARFYLANEERVLFGGAAGGGKSEALLCAALQYADIGGHAGMIVRKNFTALNKPGALMDRAESWLKGRGAAFDRYNHTWTFPSGYRLTFVAMDSASAVEIIQGAEFCAAFIDEAGQLTKKQLEFIYSRLRRPTGSIIPMRYYLASNPDGPSEMDLFHEFVEPFTKGQKSDSLFIPANSESNPHIDAEYRERLGKLSPVMRAKFLLGQWCVKAEGLYFKRDKFIKIPRSEVPTEFDAIVRAWDLAATEPNRDNTNPDWTRGLLVGIVDGRFYIIDMKSLRHRPFEVENLIKKTAAADGREVTIVLPQDPGQAGKVQYAYWAARLAGLSIKKDSLSGNKELRAQPVSSSVDAKNVYVVEAAWTEELLDELCSFPPSNDEVHDDIVDALSSAWLWLPHLAKQQNGKVRIGVGVDPDGRAKLTRPSAIERPPAIRRM